MASEEEEEEKWREEIDVCSQFLPRVNNESEMKMQIKC